MPCLRFVSALISLLLLTAASSPPTPNREAQVQDLEFARANYVMTSKAFSVGNREAALRFIDQLKTRAGKLSNEQFLVSVLQLAAFAHNGHDSFDDGDGWIPPNRLPFRMIWFPDHMIIARAGPEYKDLLGARVKAIERIGIDDLLVRLRSVCGGPDRYLRWNTPWIIENAGLLEALGMAKTADKLEFELALRDNRRTTRTVSFVARKDLPAGLRPPRLWSADPASGETEKGWRAAIDSAKQPFYLQKGDEPFRIEPLPGADAVYLQFRANSTADAGGVEIGQFVKRVINELETNPPNNVILDLRFDIGGNIDETRDLARVIVNNVQRRIYVLTGPYTFSAGIVMAAAVKHDGGNKVTVVGDHVGDNLRWWSESKHVCLPHSKYCLNATNGFWDLVKGCAGEPDCYGDKYDAVVGSLDPQLRAPLTSGDWLSGKDPAMEAVLRDLAEGSGD